MHGCMARATHLCEHAEPNADAGPGNINAKLKSSIDPFKAFKDPERRTYRYGVAVFLCQRPGVGRLFVWLKVAVW